MKPATQVTIAIRAMMVATELVGELELGPLVQHEQRQALDAVIVAGAHLESLRASLLKLERLTRARARRRKAARK